jgi:integrase
METVTVQIIVRHSADCPDRAKGNDYRKCKCRKSLVVYNALTKKTQRISCKTRSWEGAEDFARDYKDSFDPVQQELKTLRAEKQAKQVTVEEAVKLYLTDMIARLGDNGTVSGARHLLESQLLDFLAKLPASERPSFVSEITPTHLIAFRASWKLGDLTAAIRWNGVKSFFNFCERQSWIEDSPARHIRPAKVKHGGRTAIFTDQQYQAILTAARKFPRSTAFIELARWSGMSLSDLVQFRPEMIDPDGVLKYRRHKTGELAVVPLPQHVIVLLRGVPLDRNSVGAGQPFRTKGTILKSDVRTWQRELGRIFKLAGITSVKNENGESRQPHPHQLRDSFAVAHLKNGVSIYSVARMLGHSSINTTEQSYLPWCPELETAHIQEVRAALAKATPKISRGRRVVNIVNR